MGRPRKNKLEEFFIANNYEVKHNLSHVKIPFFLKAIYKEKIGEYNNGKPIYGTTDQIVRYLHFTKDEITKKFQEKGLEIINFEQVTVLLPDLCPQCRRTGIPKIEKYSNKYDYHPRRGSPMFRKSGTEKTEVNRPYEYWLCYDHETKPKKCRVAKWDKNHLIFTKNGKIYTKLRKYIFPKYVGWKKGELDAFGSFQKFLNVLHP